MTEFCQVSTFFHVIEDEVKILSEAKCSQTVNLSGCQYLLQSFVHFLLRKSLFFRSLLMRKVLFGNFLINLELMLHMLSRTKKSE